MVQKVVNLILVLVRSPVVGDVVIKSHEVQADKLSGGMGQREYDLLYFEMYKILSEESGTIE